MPSDQSAATLCAHGELTLNYTEFKAVVKVAEDLLHAFATSHETALENE